MRYIIISIFALSFTSTLTSQIEEISGVVLDGITEAPLAYASIYYDGTTIGTTTDEDGQWILPYNTYHLDVVVSYVGYETIQFRLDPQKLAKNYKLILAPSQEALEEAEIQDTRSETWRNKYALFKGYFIGQSVIAKKCTIDNAESVYFNPSYTEGLQARANESLEIVNDVLGYTIRYDLVDFTFSQLTRRLIVTGYAQFIPMNGSSKQLKKWKKQRKKAYIGSSQHLWDVLRDSTFDNSNFTIREMEQKEVEGFHPGTSPIRQSTATGSGRPAKSTDESNKAKSKGAPSSPGFVVSSAMNTQMTKYYPKKEKLNPYDHITYEGDNIIIHQETPWHIVYYGERMDRNYIEANIENPDFHPKKQVSKITFTNGKIILNGAGRLVDPLSTLFEGYMAFEQRAEILPLDYEPTEE